MTSGVSISDFAASSCSKIHARLTPFFSASKLERWIVMPSAIGSENGMPSSTTSPTGSDLLQRLDKLIGVRIARRDERHQPTRPSSLAR